MRRSVVLGVAIVLGAAEFTVSMAGMQYQPGTIEAKVGDTITFVNDDVTDHEVFVPTQGFGIDYGVQKPGAKVNLPLRKAGTFEVECVFHDHMKVSVTVTK